MRRDWIATLLLATAVVLLSSIAPAVADDPTPSESPSPSAEPTDTSSPTPTPTATAESPSPTSSPHSTQPHSTQLPTSGGGPAHTGQSDAPTPMHAQASGEGSGAKPTDDTTTQRSGVDPYLIDVANDTLRQATRKARAAQAAATDAQRTAKQAQRAADQAARVLVRAQRAAVGADEVMGEVARAMYAYNLDSDWMQDPESVMWLAPIDADSPSDFVEQSAQLSHIADNITQRFDKAQELLDRAVSSRAAAESSAADARVAVDEARSGAEVALTAQRAAKQVFLRLANGSSAGGDEAWWANEFASSDLGQLLAALTGGPSVQLDFRRLGSGAVTSDYGMRMHPILDEYKLHTGIDYAPGDGKIRAAMAGRVVRAGFDVAYGNYVVLHHGQFRGRSVATLYAHSAALYVRPGDRVGRGDVLGLVGSSGYATGAHLHVELRLDGRPVNPGPFIN